MDRCSPCTRTEICQLAPDLPPGLSIEDLRTAWRAGLSEVARVAGCSRPEAAHLAWSCGLVEHGPKLDRAAFVAIVEHGDEPASALARRLGVSRWTVSAWRQALPLH